MKYISSDTNVWIDFLEIGELQLPFKLPYTYIMSELTVQDEILNPPELGRTLLSYGLVAVELTTDELILAGKYYAKYRNPSRYDCIALAIAKQRNIVLMTGDKHLRAAAESENVLVIGTIGILDQLYETETISTDEYAEIIKKLQKENGGKVRLPTNALAERLEKLGKKGR